MDDIDDPTGRGRGTSTWVAASAVAVVVAYSVVAALIEPFTHPSAVVTGLGIVAVVAVAVRTGWHRRGPVGEPPEAPGPHWWWALAIWGVLVAAIGLFQMAQFQSNPRDVYPTLSSLLSIAFGSRPVRATTIAIWIGLGLYIIGPRLREALR